MASATDVYFPTVLEAGKFKIKVQQGLVSGESSLPGLQTSSCASPGLSSTCVHEERVRSLASLLIKTLLLLDRAMTLWLI